MLGEEGLLILTEAGGFGHGSAPLERGSEETRCGPLFSCTRWLWQPLLPPA